MIIHISFSFGRRYSRKYEEQLGYKPKAHLIFNNDGKDRCRDRQNEF